MNKSGSKAESGPNPNNQSSGKNFEDLSSDAQDFVLNLASTALEGVKYSKDLVEELIEKRKLGPEHNSILSQLKRLGVLEEKDIKKNK